MSYPTPPLTPYSGPSTSPALTKHRTRFPSPLSSPPISPDFALPPPLSSFPPMEDLELPEPSLSVVAEEPEKRYWQDLSTIPEDAAEQHVWRKGMTGEEKDARGAWLAGGRGRKGMRIVIVTENFLPKVDGVTRTLARLLEHLEKEGHQCMLLGPGTGMSHYASHPLVGTWGVPLVVYPGLKLNFLRPAFLRSIKQFEPDVVHFVDMIWVGAQVAMAMELGWAGEDWVSTDGPALGSGIRGAVVASYHTNLAQYATLYGMSWLTPIMYRFQAWLYSKAQLTLCPSQSTKESLASQNFSGVRIWPRGVDLSQFSPSKRSAEMRASWGVGPVPSGPACSPPRTKVFQVVELGSKHLANMPGVHHSGRKVSLPLTPPGSPLTLPTTGNESEPESLSLGLPERVVLLYVGRVSWEKNLHLLLAAYKRLPPLLPVGSLMPQLVFVGDGPAKQELEEICLKEGHGAVFMGHRQGEELARCYASADVFAFPSFTETFGQVVLEALASGLPVIGLDAEGTRDLVVDGKTGLLLPLPTQTCFSGTSSRSWPTICRNRDSSLFADRAASYAVLLSRAITDHVERRHMGLAASTEASAGRTWWDAMEKCVDGYRESMRMARDQRVAASAKLSAGEVFGDESAMASCSTATLATTPARSRLRSVNRAVSRRLAHKGKWEDEEVVPRVGLLRRVKNEAESVWHLKTLFKVVVVAALFYGVYTRHHASRARLQTFDIAEVLSA